MDPSAGPPPFVDKTNIKQQVFITHSILPSLSLILFLLRLYTRTRVIKALGWEDLLLGLGWSFAASNDILMMHQTKYGLGRHVLNVQPYEFPKFFQILFACTLVYCSAGLCIRNSLLLFYTRLTQERKFTIAAYSLITLNCTIWLASVVPGAFGCNPIALYWDKSLGGTCINHEKLYLANGIMNIFMDAATLALPIPIIWGSQGMSLEKKLKVTILFLIGGVVVIAGIVRVPKVQFAFREFLVADATWSAVESNMWSQIELHLAIITACIPTSRPLFIKIRNAVFGTQASTTSATWESKNKSYPKVSAASRSGAGTITDTIALQTNRIHVENYIKIDYDKAQSQEELAPGRVGNMSAEKLNDRL